MKHGKLLSLACLALVMALLCCGCVSPVIGDIAPRDTVVHAMDTDMSLRVYGDPDGEVSRRLEELLLSLDGDLSVTSPTSALTELNETGVTDNPHVLALCRTGQELSARTGGALDLTLYPATRLWGFTGTAYRVPEAAELQALDAVTGMEHLHPGEAEVRLDAGSLADLGSLAKGYAADLCRKELESCKCSAILSLGGNLQTVGEKPDGSDWVVGIQDPADPGAFAAVLTLKGSHAVVTSGDYQRYFEQDGTRYCHIFDPETLSPVQNELRSVTVVASQGVLADGLATALYVLGMERGADLWRESGDFEALWVSSDGTVTVTAGLEHLVSQCEFDVVRR